MPFLGTVHLLCPSLQDSILSTPVFSCSQFHLPHSQVLPVGAPEEANGSLFISASPFCTFEKKLWLRGQLQAICTLNLFSLGFRLLMAAVQCLTPVVSFLEVGWGCNLYLRRSLLPSTQSLEPFSCFSHGLQAQKHLFSR